MGKSTIFNALTGAGAAAANYPFCTIDPNVGVVALEDARMAQLAAIAKSEKILPTTVEFVDIAGLVKGASQGEGLGNQFLSHIRAVDAVVHVVRCFEDPDVVHVHGKIDPAEDVQVIHLEFVLADLEIVEKRLERVAKNAKIAGNVDAQVEHACFARVVAGLRAGTPVRRMQFSADELPFVQQAQLLTAKPMLYAANLSETDIRHPENCVAFQRLREIAAADGGHVIPLCGKLEAEISELSPEDRTTFLAEVGLTESGLNRLARTTYGLLGLVTYFTTGPKETRAWTITRGTLAPAAAGKIHSDLERGFIRAETYHCDDLFAHGSEAALRAKGLIRQEGREYPVKDGDVLFIKFNV